MGKRIYMKHLDIFITIVYTTNEQLLRQRLTQCVNIKRICRATIEISTFVKIKHVVYLF